MAEARFDELVHAPQRLRICAILAPVEGVEFTEVLQRTGLSKSALSKHVTQLAEAGYVTTTAIVRGGRSRQVLALGPEGRDAYAGHRAALQRILHADLDAETDEFETAAADDRR